MNTVQATQDKQSKTPFYQSEHDQDKPVGYLFLHGDALVLEFQGEHPTISIKQATARKSVEFVSDSTLRIELPDNPGKKIRIHLSADGEGRFAVYGIRNWTGIDGTELRSVKKQMYLARFDSTLAKLVATWQFVLPWTLFGIVSVLQSVAVESTPGEVKCFVNVWQWLALSPAVAVHIVILLVPAVAVLFFNRIWGLQVMFRASLLLVLIITCYGFFPDGWQFLPMSDSSSSLVLPEYWLVFVPYMILLFVPSAYYVIVMPRM